MAAWGNRLGPPPEKQTRTGREMKGICILFRQSAILTDRWKLHNYHGGSTFSSRHSTDGKGRKLIPMK